MFFKRRNKSVDTDRLCGAWGAMLDALNQGRDSIRNHPVLAAGLFHHAWEVLELTDPSDGSDYERQSAAFSWHIIGASTLDPQWFEKIELYLLIALNDAVGNPPLRDDELLEIMRRNADRLEYRSHGAGVEDESPAGDSLEWRLRRNRLHLEQRMRTAALKRKFQN